jgi:8-oxo-dGTP pyrophosphatase MutT (NUDIX family)
MRRHLTALLEEITPFDALERAHRDDALAWVASGAPLHRLSKPDVPAKHLVSYFVALDEQQQILLGDHRKAGLWLPSGGHVEPDETPWGAVVRECREELHVQAVPSPVVGAQPCFVTVTSTRGPDEHIDVSFWFVLTVAAGEITWFDEREFTAIRWVGLEGVLREPLSTLDPHMHRFARKASAVLAAHGAGRTALRGDDPCAGPMLRGDR